jgi:ferritin-like metal-binding protein YciE
MEMDSLKKLYEEQLKDLHSMERQIIQALPKMIKAAEDEELSTELAKHLEITKEQLARLDSIFESMGKSGKGKKCKGIEGIIEEGKELLEEDAEPDVLDAGIIAAAQHVEHYEMAGYGTVAAYARLLGDRRAENLLRQSLAEEKEADERLSALAESRINVEATAGSSR